MRAVNEAAAGLAELDRAVIGALLVNLACERECERQARACDGPRLPVLDQGGFTIDCPDDGLPCRKEVPEICQLISGVCGDCWTSLCGDRSVWAFEFGPSVDTDIALVAARGPSMKARVLATSSMRGKQAVLTVPADLKLDGTELLYFEFRSKTKPGGPVKVRVQKM
jgi:hypothetical protein